MDRQYFSLLDRQLFWESLQPQEDHFAPSLYLDMATWVDEYSPKAVVIFTVRKDDRFLLKGIGARFNPWLTHQGRKCAGWIFPQMPAGTTGCGYGAVSLCMLLPFTYQQQTPGVLASRGTLSFLSVYCDINNIVIYRKCL